MTQSHEFPPMRNPQRDGPPFHIAFGVDARFAPAMGVTITSILVNNPNINIVFHVIANHIRPDDLKKLQNLAEQHAVDLQLHTIDRQAFSALPDPKQLSHAIYNRLLIGSLLRGVAPKVLYLDSDIVCLGDISGLNALDMGDAIIAAVKEASAPCPQRMAAIGMPQAAPYFNSGVLYIDLGRWDKHEITRKAIDRLTQSGRQLAFFDQDALNLVLLDKVAFINAKWNTLYWRLGPNHHIPAETVFLHYAIDKPWYEWSPCFHDPTFKKYRDRSPWADCPMYDPNHDYPRSRRDKKRYARHLLNTGDILGASRWYLKYLATRKATGKS
jgi:lipopolysaccharide biosynthesis glycosyltransferase